MAICNKQEAYGPHLLSEEQFLVTFYFMQILFLFKFRPLSGAL